MVFTARATGRGLIIADVDYDKVLPPGRRRPPRPARRDPKSARGPTPTADRRPWYNVRSGGYYLTGNSGNGRRTGKCNSTTKKLGNMPLANPACYQLACRQPAHDCFCVRMRTVLLPMCPTDGPMARGAREGTSLAIA